MNATNRSVEGMIEHIQWTSYEAKQADWPWLKKIKYRAKIEGLFQMADTFPTCCDFEPLSDQFGLGTAWLLWPTSAGWARVHFPEQYFAALQNTKREALRRRHVRG